MPQALPGDLERLFLKLLEELRTPLAQRLTTLVKTGGWDEIASLRLDPSTYDDPDVYFRDAVAANFLRHCEDLPTSFDRKAVAFKGWLDAERLCRRTNSRLDVHFSDNVLCHYGDSLRDSESACSRLIAEARKEMSKLLGSVPRDLRGLFGPGATYGDKGLYTTVPDKMTSRPTLTPSAVKWILHWRHTLWAKACSADGGSIDCVRGNRFSTVPKDCTKDRAIAVEPSINIFYQLALGRAMRSALKRNGNIDLTHGQAIHRQVACEASNHGWFATIDLSSASDTLCSNLVKLLLPQDWFELCSSLRSPFTLVEGKWWKLEKFSSMGNGFTFELETAVFLAVILAVRNLRSIHEPLEAMIEPGRDVFVYGDDIIIPTDYASDVVSALAYVGFTTNKGKSFLSGPFRESCGGDYFRGVDVRPFFLKEYPHEPQHWIALANGIKRMAGHNGWMSSRASYLLSPWFAALDQIPSQIRKIRGPRSLGDLVIEDEVGRWQTRKRGSLVYIRIYRPSKFRKVKWENFRPDVHMAAAIYGVGRPKREILSVDDAFKSWIGTDGVTPRDAVLGYKIGWVPLLSQTSKWLPSS